MKLKSISQTLRKNQLYLIISIVVPFTLLLVTYEVLTYRSFLIDKVSTVAGLISRSIEPALTFKDLREVRRVLKTIDNQKEVVSATVFDPENNLLVSTESQFDQKIHFHDSGWGHIESDDFYYLKKIKDSDHKTIGSLVIVVTLRPFLNELFLIVFLTVLASIIGTYVSQFIMNKLTNRIVIPLKNLGSKISLISQSKNYNLSLIDPSDKESSSYEEIDILIREFEQMMDVIRTSSNELIMMNANLENLVTQRTSERDLERLKAVQSGKIAALGAMSAGIAHEINNPMATIKVSADLLSMMVAEKTYNEALLIKVTNDINSMVARVTTIIKSLRSFTRDGSQDPLEEVDIYSIVEDTLIFVKNRYKNNNVLLEVNVPKNEIKVNCRSSQISQVLLNLLNNAYDAIEALEDRWVKIDCFKEQDKVVMTVTDCGPGIPKHILARLFEPFYTTKGLGKGTGIGLSISASIMESNNGKLVYDSTCSNTRFRIEFYNQPLGVQEK